MVEDIQIYQWNNIRSRFSFDDTTLILGNGASIAVDAQFCYESLFKKAEVSILSDTSKALFTELKTEDFELILNKLREAKQINRALQIDDGHKTSEIYTNIRNGLIRAVRENHTEYRDIQEIELKMHNVRKFIQGFKNVINLNYDLIVYWAMMKEGLFDDVKHSFKDCFIRGVFDAEWEKYYEFNGNKATLVFYPHGNLVLATDSAGLEHKIQLDQQSTLLEEILGSWNSNNKLPLFVSEGDSEQKKNAIKRSPYLSVVFDEVLRNLSDNIVIYGWKMAPQDDHILERICKRNTNLKTIAISIYTPGHNEMILDQLKIIEKIKKYNDKNDSIEVLFFDSGSPGCWINSDL